MRRAVILFSLLSLTGCAVGQVNRYGEMIPGRLISLADGTLIPVQLELTTGSGRITAIHPTTGETFTGTYTAISEAKSTQYTKETFWGGTEQTQQAVETSASVPATAVMVGNKGMVINIKMRVKPGNARILPIGYGEAEDNKGGKYNFQF